MQPDDWRRAHSDTFYLSVDEPESLATYLRAAGLLPDGEHRIRVEKAGEGNMNCTARVITGTRSFIVKQSRPWVEKYPQFDAPWDRALREMEFYERIAGNPEVARQMPRLLHADPHARILVLEDLGVGRDYTGIYRGDVISEPDLTALARFLSSLHASFEGTADHRGLANREMRQLNARHIFHIPLQRDNGLDLDALSPGLADCAGELISDAEFVAMVDRLSTIYLADGDQLLHGDFFPGSILKTADGPRIIDPEFAYFGRSEFDPAVFIAHLLLGRQPGESIRLFLDTYAPPSTHDEALMIQLAGVEIMRRLIGYAQLPLGYGTAQRKQLLEMSRQMVLEPDKERLAARHA